MKILTPKYLHLKSDRYRKAVSLLEINFLRLLIYTLFILITFTSGFPYDVHAQRIDYKAQSLYLYQFSRFVYWPPKKMEGDFVIGVYGNSPIVKELQLMASLKKAANGSNITIKSIDSITDSMGIHILYVSASKSREIKMIVSAVENLSILIVAERGGLAKKGACVNFIILENDTLRFEVNKAALKKRNLDMAEELLKLGFIVG